MNEQFLERLADIQDLERMLDDVASQKKDEIIQGKQEITDIIKHEGLTFNIQQNGQDVTVTKDVYEVLVQKDGELYHEFYDDQGNMLMPAISDKAFNEGKILSELENGSFDENSLIANIYKDQDSKSLEELEKEQTKEVAGTLGMDEKDIKELDLVQVDTNKPVKPNDIQEKLKSYMALGMIIDTNELATSDDTIKEFLNIDANQLLAIRINNEWKIFKIDDKGNLALENNLQLSSATQSFNTIGEDGKRENRMPEVEFYRKDNPNMSLAIDSDNRDNKTQAFLIAGNSRTATEIESTSAKSPYADAKNNELVQKAQENPDKAYLHEEEPDVDPHEPSLEPKPY